MYLAKLEKKGSQLETQRLKDVVENRWRLSAEWGLWELMGDEKLKRMQNHVG
jgi:hypothetical protein